MRQHNSSRVDSLLGMCDISNLVKISREPRCTRVAMTEAITGELPVEQECSVTRMLASPANAGVQRRRADAIRAGPAVASIKGRKYRRSRRSQVLQSGPGRIAYCNIGGTSMQFHLGKCTSKDVTHSWCSVVGTLQVNVLHNSLSQGIIKRGLRLLLHEELFASRIWSKLYSCVFENLAPLSLPDSSASAASTAFVIVCAKNGSFSICMFVSRTLFSLPFLVYVSRKRQCQHVSRLHVAFQCLSVVRTMDDDMSYSASGSNSCFRAAASCHLPAVSRRLHPCH